MTYQRRVAPPRKTEEERRLTHEALYGAGAPLPARGYRFTPQVAGLQGDTTTLLLLLLGAGALFWLLSRK